MWTPTPPLSGRRTPRPGPARVCVCVPCLAGSGEPASWAPFGAPHLFPWPFMVRSLLVRPPPGWGCPVCDCCWVFFFWYLLPFLPLVAPPFCPALRVFRPRMPWALASCPPPPLLLSLPPLGAPSCLLLCVSSGLGCLGPWHLIAPPPLFFIFLPPPRLLFLAFPAFWLPWASAPPPPSLLLFFSPFFYFFPSLFAGCAVWGGFVCLGPLGLPQWCCPCRCSVCAGWCCVVLAVGPGCPLLSPGGSWCRASVVLSLSGRVARRPVARRGVSWCSAALCCVLLRCAVVWWCAVVRCRLFASVPVPVVWFLPLRVCCV